MSSTYATRTYASMYVRVLETLRKAAQSDRRVPYQLCRPLRRLTSMVQVVLEFFTWKVYTKWTVYTAAGYVLLV